MRPYEVVKADAMPGQAFANGSEFEHWASRWCLWSCRHEDDCPLLMVAMADGVTPKEWQTGTPGQKYICIEFDVPQR